MLGKMPTFMNKIPALKGKSNLMRPAAVAAGILVGAILIWTGKVAIYYHYEYDKISEIKIEDRIGLVGSHFLNVMPNKEQEDLSAEFGMPLIKLKHEIKLISAYRNPDGSFTISAEDGRGNSIVSKNTGVLPDYIRPAVKPFPQWGRE